MNDDNDKTVVRPRAMPFRPAAKDGPEHGLNALPVGAHLGEFEILDLIGEGGFGIVYLAYDHSLERHVALKEYMPAGLATRTAKMGVTVMSQHNLGTFTAGLKSFINEAKMLAQFDSPSLVKVHRFWEGNGTAYMAMPFYEGVTLKQALKEQRITPNEPWVRLLLADLFDAIETIHGAQCFHRDIAPDNILLLKDSRPLLLDFGAARRVIGDLTQCLTVILKPGFAPIEQYADITGLRQGAWTDIYALAAVVYYVIAGKAPPPAVARFVHDEMVPAREAGKGKYSNAFLSVIDKALAVRPEQRFRTIDELRRALDIMETVPRTLPRSTMQQSARGMKTIPMAAAEPGPAFAAQRDDNWEEAWRSNRFSEDRMKRSKPVLVVLGLVLSAGIGAAVFLGTNRLWHGAPESSTLAAARGKPAVESSGSGAAMDQDQGLATAPAAAPASVAPPAPAAPTVAREPDKLPASPPSARIATAPPQKNAVAAPKPEPEQRAPQEQRLSREDDAWRIASSSDTASAYESYLRKYPKGRFAPVAKLRLENRQAKASVPPATARKPAAQSDEEELWGLATVIDQAPAFDAYLNRYPNGRYVALARDKKASLEKAARAAAPQAEAAKPEVQEPPRTEGNAPAAAEKQAAIKPQEPSAPPAKHAVESAPESAPEPKAVQPLGMSRKSIRLPDLTLAGDFTVEPGTGKVTGTGKIIWNNGNRFEGTMVRGVKTGKGQFVWNNGQSYNGDWARDMPNGRGTIVFADGNRYTGDVKDGLPHGHGVNRFKDGDVYSGAWVMGKSQGHGRYTWRNGGYWEGEFKDDKRTDNGKMVFAEGATGTPAERQPAAPVMGVAPQTPAPETNKAPEYK